jgi:hypothetical protein
MISNNGSTWQTAQTFPSVFDLGSVTWSPQLGCFIAVAGNNIIRSFDGNVWTVVANPNINQEFPGTFLSVTWSPELHLLLAVSSAGVAATSPNGTEWVVRNAKSGNSTQGSTWSPQLGCFIVVGSSSNVADCATSAFTNPWRISSNNILQNGNARIGLGVENPSFRLDLPNIASADGQGRANAWTTYSDARVKTDIHDLTGCLETIQRLRPKRFKQHTSDFGGPGGTLRIMEDESRESLGLIAQEALHVVPEAVIVPEDEARDLYTMNYTMLIPLLIGAVKELKQGNDELEARITKLEHGTV